MISGDFAGLIEFCNSVTMQGLRNSTRFIMYAQVADHMYISI